MSASLTAQTASVRQQPAWPGRKGRVVVDAGATFGDPNYRYRLWREYEHGAQKAEQMTFVMLNPSTATAETDDATIRRCLDFALRRDYCRIEVVNLFAWRSTNPNVLAGLPYPIGAENDRYILDSALRASVVVCAWGSGGALQNRGSAVRRMLRRQNGIALHHFGLTKEGHPRHPLYLKNDTTLNPWKDE
jgi:hypothetical protein